MYLKKLELYGFKSFANKIELDFEKGVTAIVGPNGSGKSNISDAIRWALGEQSIKSLRGNKMEDVIFTGTNDRKALSMVEVSLTLDNNSQYLPIEYDEITITRRMYRSGESEYYLNKSVCRLRDIRELFMDTGVGKDGYSIIGQGKIDEILSTRSEERRQLFEEAVGIVKYKHRKVEAEKKLKSTKDNLVRITDILYELENQIGPLKNQSIKAQKYIELKESLLKYEVNLFVKEIDKIDLELKHIHKQMNVLKDSLSTQMLEKDRLNNRLESLEEKLNLVEDKISEYRDDYHSTQKEISRYEGEINVNQEQIGHYTYNVNRLEEEIQNLSKSKQKMRIGLDEKLNQLKQLDFDIELIEKEVQNKTAEYDRINNLKTLKQEDIEKSKSHIIDILNQISDMKSQGNSYKTLVDTMQHRISQINESMKIYNNNKITASTQIAEVESDLDKLKFDFKNTIDKTTDIRIKKDSLINKESVLLKQLETLTKQIQHKESRKNIIDEMEKGHEGYNKGVKNVLLACEENFALRKGVYGTVASLIKVPPTYELAIETGLGASIQHIVTHDEETAKKLINYLKTNKLGRITALPLSSMVTRTINNSELKTIKAFGEVKIASEIIEFDNKFTNIISNLLSRVLIVPNIDIGIKLAKALQHRFKIVTLDGDVMNIGGSITGGGTTFRGVSLLGRKREMEELTQSIKKMCQEYEKNKIVLSKLSQLKNTLLKEEELLKVKEQEMKIQEVTLTSRLQQCTEDNKKIHLSIQQIKNELREINEAKKITLEKYNNACNEIQLMEKAIVNTEHSLKDYEKGLLAGNQQLDILNEEITKKRIGLVSVQEQKRALLHEIDNLQRNLEENDIQASEKDKEIIDLSKKRASSKENLNIIKSDLHRAINRLKILDENLNQEKRLKQKLIDDSRASKIIASQVEEIICELNESSHKLDVKATRLEIQQETFYNKLWEEYELTYNHAKKIKGEIAENINIIKEVKILKDEIKLLGNINLESVEEYKIIKERYQFLKEQKDDLESAGLNLYKIIKDMEKTMEKQFLDEFGKIQEKFQEVFVKLFGGGKAELILEDESDILNCGIEIIAQPPGKKLQSLSLLSGGEKALTAISLLFGILLVKPSPFCILDEIEAALDEVNVNRFASFLQELSLETQFIVVTHRRGTMENANVLYGVTMEEKGVSKIVSVKLSDEFNKEIAS